MTQRTCHEIQTLSRLAWSVAKVPFVAVDAPSLHTGELLHVVDHRAEGVPIGGIAMQCLGMEHELSPFGEVTGVAILSLQPNS